MARTHPDDTTDRLWGLAVIYLRVPVGAYVEDGVPTLDFDPPLSAEERTTYALLLALARSGMDHLTPSDWAAIRPHLQTLRDFRQFGRAAFMAQTAAERDRMLYDAQVATMAVLLTLLRD